MSGSQITDTQSHKCEEKPTKVSKKLSNKVEPLKESTLSMENSQLESNTPQEVKINNRSDQLTEDKKREFYTACRGERVEYAGQSMWRADIEKVKQILSEVKLEHLHGLLLFENKNKCIGLDMALENKDEKCILTITEHILSQDLTDPGLLCIVFPYAAFRALSKLTKMVLEKYPNHTSKLLKAVTHKNGMSVLHISCKYGNESVVNTIKQYLLEFGVQNPVTDKSESSLQGYDKGLIGSLLLEEDNDNMTPLHWASKGGHIKIASALLDVLQTCDEDIIKGGLLKQGRKCGTALHLACEKENTKIVSALLTSLQKCGQQFMKEVLLKRDRKNWTALHWAFETCNEEIISNLLSSLNACGSDVKKENILLLKDGHYPVFHNAFHNGHTEIVSLLITTLHEYGEEEMEGFLLKSGDYKRTPLQLASLNNHAEIVSIILTSLKKCGVEAVEKAMLQKDLANMTALNLAFLKGHTEIESDLLASLQVCSKATIKEVLLKEDMEERTPLHRAIQWGQNEIVRAILGLLQICGKDVLQKELLEEDYRSRMPPLHHACKEGHSEIVSTVVTSLQACGRKVIKEALLKEDREFKMTPLHCACKQGHFEIVSALLTALQSCGAEVIEAALKKLDREDKTALHMACEGGHTKIASILLESLQAFGVGVLRDSLLKKDVGFMMAKGSRTALHFACMQGHTKLVSTILVQLKTCGEKAMKDALLMQDGYGRTALYMACIGGHSEIVSDLLDSLECCPTTNIKDALLLQSEEGLTALDGAISQHHVAVILLISLKVIKDSDTCRKLKLLAHTRETFDRNPFAEVDSETWHFVLSHYLNKIEAAENEIQILGNLVEQLGKNIETIRESKKQKELLENEHAKLEMYVSSLQYLPLVASEKNQFGESLYHYGDLASVHTQLLDKCKNCIVESKSPFSDIFPAFYFHQCENVPYSRAAPIHPLTVLGEAGNLAIIKHPYIITQVNACWSYFGWKLFYANLVLYILYLLLLIIFFVTHRVESENQSLAFQTNVPILTEISRYGTILLALCGLIFETVQIKTKKQQYFTQAENYIDLFLFICSPVIMILTLIINYNEHVHWCGSILIVVAGIRAAWLFTHVNILGIGHGFRMLFSVLLKVAMFSPILLFFIVIFSVVFHNLLQNQQPFSHMGFSIMRIMAMSIGELDFTGTFFDETNVHIFEIVAFLMCVLFLAIMTISMMNLLIGIAVGDVAELYKQGEQADFKSKVDLILQYSYMLPNISKGISARPLCELYRWGKWKDIDHIEKIREQSRNEHQKREFEEGKKNNDPISKMFQKSLSNTEAEYVKYRVSPDTLTAVEVKIEKAAKQTDIGELKDQIAKQNSDIMKQMEKQNDKIQQLDNIITKQSQQIDKIIAHLVPEHNEKV